MQTDWLWFKLTIFPYKITFWVRESVWRWWWEKRKYDIKNTNLLILEAELGSICNIVPLLNIDLSAKIFEK